MVEEKEGEIKILLEEWEKEDVVIQKKVWILAIEKMASGRKDITSKHIQALLELAEKEVGSFPFWVSHLSISFLSKHNKGLIISPVTGSIPANPSNPLPLHK